MSDYGAPTPVWTDESTVLSDLALLRLPEHLAAALQVWLAHFEAHFAVGFAWDTEDNRLWYVEEGEVLRDRLSRALDGCEVILDLWPGLR
jgi:hypothetical protein